MLTLLDRFKSKKPRESKKKEAKCTCGEVVVTIPTEKKEMYFCSSCNKLLYFVESDLEIPKIIPFSLAWLKRKK